ncbi:hypothetical protein FPV67DRAFT_1504054 [Lyophyllum atratum]|nr:hypothetical protein FPV67DRAFT_1504054 [Lyophyllum atratum]
MSPPRPHLPTKFIKQIVADRTLSDGYESMVFTDQFHAARLQMVDVRASESRSPDAVHGFELEGGRKNPFPDHLLGRIHIAAVAADILAVCELIRLGAVVDLEDSAGHTALNIAISFITMPLMTGNAALLGPAHLARSTYIVRMLVEQHADVNHTPKTTMSPLHWACCVRNWDLIALLLKHGAKHPADMHVVFPNDPSNLRRFYALRKAHPPGQERPPQKCPCWSGKLLKDCHAVKQPYPDEFYCTCGSKKLYGKCCARRNIMLFEIWNPKLLYLQQFHFRTAGLVAIGDGLEKSTTDEMVRAHYISVPREYLDSQGLTEEEAFEFLGRIVIALSPQKQIDPAFAFAMRETQFLPRPQGRSFSKIACEAAEKQWNMAIDKYIASNPPGARSSIDIECAAKIRHTGGALFRTCEGPKCMKIEGKDIEKLNVCSKCRMSVYCSRTCQTAAWKQHKTICGDASQREQALPSQIAIDRYLLSAGKHQKVEDLDWSKMFKESGEERAS